ncbi:MAG: hypothetical protein LBO78_03435, partial [Rickettsiales bacterium]|nr:hypothetical protein [Rickettsiales bacterium]
ERQVKTPEARAGLADEIAKELSRIKNESVRKFYTDDFNARMRMEFSKIIRAESVAVPKANPENPNEKMILAFSIAYPNMFSKFLESGRKIELSHPVYKKIFAEVAAELSVRPHTRETILRHLEEKGFRPENLLKFEMESLLAKPETAHAIIEEKILSAMRDSLKAELSALNKAMLSAGAAEVEKIRAQIRNIALELEGVDEKLEKLEY